MAEMTGQGNDCTCVEWMKGRMNENQTKLKQT